MSGAGGPALTGVSPRTVVVTGSASGIGAATSALLRSGGCRVIGVDLRDADVVVDLATPAGRTTLMESVRALAPEGIDGIVANAGVNRPDSLTIRVNYFGAVATLLGLRPLLRGPAPRAVLVASRAVVLDVDDEIVEACLSGDEERAIKLADARSDSTLYASSKRAVARWMRQVATTPEWAGTNVPLNAVAPGAVATPMIAHRSAEEQARLLEKRPMPLGGVADADEVASAIGWFLSEENTKVTGQVLFVDGGGEVLMCGEDLWGTQAPSASASASDAWQQQPTEQRLQQLLDREEIRQVMYAYARGTDRLHPELIGDAYHHDAWDDHGNFRGGGDLVVDTIMTRGASVPTSMHHLGNMLIELLGDTANVETYFMACQVLEQDGKTHTRMRAGRYLDRFERRDGRWRVARRVVVDDWSRLDEVVLPAPTVTAECNHGTRDGSDPSFTLSDFSRLHEGRDA